ncbi:MAG: tetratricopeptide repeat protein [Lachnospiraceae bacterium]|nr:tetratricopeptide repeat protein [Lachnospiraceae bacterium]
MNCMYCGAELTKDNYCPNCSADVRIYKKIVQCSNHYYNEGLEKASVRDLTGAVESLNKSLRFYKMNTQARNLLGLVYFEMGETVSALGEWVISRNLQSRENDAERYLNAIQKNPSKLEALNQTIKKYNQALLYCKQDSRDLAKIQLKKVLSLNPKLIKGHQLLALLYIQEGKYEQAKKSLRAAAKIDSSNTLTLRYLKEVNRLTKGESPAVTKKNEKKENLIAYKSGNETIIQPTHVKDSSALSVILNIIIGVVIGVFITWFLIVPSVKHAATSDANKAVKEANDTISTKNQTIDSLQSQIDKLQEQMNSAEDVSKENDTRLAAYDQLLSAYASFMAGDVTTAGDALANVKSEYLSNDAKAIYESISATVNEQYIQATYTEGRNAYSQQNYTDAATALQKVVDSDENYDDGNALYYLAQSYRGQEDNEKAAEYYRKMIASYPGTERAANSQKYLEAMGMATDAAGSGDGSTDTTTGDAVPAGDGTNTDAAAGDGTAADPAVPAQ